eukprot:6083973-Pyramimonas_sp.AAC.1
MSANRAATTLAAASDSHPPASLTCRSSAHPLMGPNSLASRPMCSSHGARSNTPALSPALLLPEGSAGRPDGAACARQMAQARPRAELGRGGRRQSY